MSSFLRAVSLFLLALLVTFNSALPALAQGGSGIKKEAIKDQGGPKNPSLPGGLPPNLTFSTLAQLTDTSLSYTIVNNGLGATGKGFDVQYTWLNQEKQPIQSTTEEATDTSLGAGESIFVDLPQFSFQPSKEAAFLEITVDSNEMISESIETDNTVVLVRPVVPAKPDLLVSDLFKDGEKITVLIKNNGSIPAEAPIIFWVRWVKNGVPIQTNPPYVMTTLSSFSAGEVKKASSANINQFAANPPDPEAVLQIILDPEHTIDEENELNNTKELNLNSASFSDDFSPPSLPDDLPDISVAGFVMTKEAVTIVVKNTGSVPTNQEVLLVLQWIKNNEAVGGGALEVLLGVIGAGEKVTKSFTVGDGSGAGQFFANPPAEGAFLQALVDPDNGIIEENDLDNSATAIPITSETSGKDLKALNAKGDKLLPYYEPTILPGDALYPVKGVFEKVESFFAFSKQKKVEVAVKHAAKKAKEIHTLIEKIEEETEPVKHEKLLDALEKAVQKYEDKMHAVSEKLLTLHPEEKQEHAEAAKNAFTHAINSQELVDKALDTLPAHASIAVASAHDASFTAAATALHAINEPVAQHEAIEEILHESGNPLDAVEHVAILADLADHVTDVIDAASAEEALDTASEDAVEEGEEETFDNESLAGVLAGFQEAEVAEAAVNLDILSESYGPLATDFMAEIAHETPGEVLLALDEIGEETESQWSDEAMSQALNNMADAFNTKMEDLEETSEKEDSVKNETENWSEEELEQALKNMAGVLNDKKEKATDLPPFLSLPKNDPVKSLRILEKLSGKITHPALSKKIDAAFDQEAVKLVGGLLQNNGKDLTALAKHVAKTKGSDLTQLVILEKIGSRIAAAPLTEKSRAVAERAVSEIRNQTTETIQRKIDAAPDEDSRRRKLFSILGTQTDTTGLAERARARLKIEQNDLDDVNQKREEARRRQIAIEAEFQLKREEQRRREAGVIIPVQERGVETQPEKRQEQEVKPTEKSTRTEPAEDALPAVKNSGLRETPTPVDGRKPVEPNIDAVLREEERPKTAETKPNRVLPTPVVPTTRVATSTRPATVAPTRVVPTRVLPTPSRTKTESGTVSPTREATNTQTDKNEEATRTAEPAPVTRTTDETTETRTVEPTQPTPIAPRAAESTGSTRTQSISTDASSTWSGFLDRIPLVRNFLRFTAFAGMDFLLK